MSKMLKLAKVAQSKVASRKEQEEKMLVIPRKLVKLQNQLSKL